ALAPKYDMHMLKARIGQPKMIQPMIERQPGNGDAGFAHGREVRQAHTPRFMLLPEYHLPLAAMQGMPGADPPFQRPPDPLPKFRMTPQHLLKNSNRPQARPSLQERHHLTIKNTAQGIRPPPPPGRLLQRWQSGILVDAV